MEEEKQNFTRLMKDARRRFEDFLTNLESSKPFLIPRINRRYLKANGDAITSETNRYLYRRMSFKGENSDENSSIAKVTNVSSCNKHKKLKRRFRHSVIGTGKEFRDFEYVLLNEASDFEASREDTCENKLSAVDALGDYIRQLYSSDKQTAPSKLYSDNCKAEGVNSDDVFGMKLSDRNVCCNKTLDDGNIVVRKSFSRELRRIRARKNCRSSYIPPSRIDSPERSIYTDDSVVLTREQKRRVKEKMKLALKRPNNYSYLGNL